MTNGAPLVSKEIIQWYEWRIAMKWFEFRWICGEGTVGYLYYQTTIEPTDWTGDMQRLDGVSMHWINNAPRERIICPSSDYVYKNTQITTLP